MHGDRSCSDTLSKESLALVHENDVRVCVCVCVGRKESYEAVIRTSRCVANGDLLALNDTYMYFRPLWRKHPLQLPNA